jgi:hypothetical protein
MAARLKIVRIAKTPAVAYNHDREISDLVRHQLRHARLELLKWWATFGSEDPEQFTTEQQAAQYLKVVTRILRPRPDHEARIQGSPAPKSGVWLNDPIERPAPKQRQKQKQKQKQRQRQRQGQKQKRSRTRSR